MAARGAGSAWWASGDAVTEDKTKQPGTVHRAQARKQWDCAECADPILKGQSYMYLNTFDDRSRQWSRYVLCAACERILNCHRVVELAISSELPYTSGALRQEVKALIKTSGEYKREFLLAWEGSQPAPVESSE